MIFITNLFSFIKAIINIQQQINDLKTSNYEWRPTKHPNKTFQNLQHFQINQYLPIQGQYRIYPFSSNTMLDSVPLTFKILKIAKILVMYRSKHDIINNNLIVTTKEAHQTKKNNTGSPIWEVARAVRVQAVLFIPSGFFSCVPMLSSLSQNE